VRTPHHTGSRQTTRPPSTLMTAPVM
jgi:hypothetical protein